MKCRRAARDGWQVLLPLEADVLPDGHEADVLLDGHEADPPPDQLVDELDDPARDACYGRRGRINARELHEPMNSCSCLMLIPACVIYWQAREISRLVRCRGPEDAAIDVGMLEHVSPIEWGNVILYGQYIPDRKLIR